MNKKTDPNTKAKTQTMDLSKLIPKYLVEKYNLVHTVVLTAIFSLFFINVFTPYGSRDWVKVTDAQYFLLSSFLVLLGMCVVAISRVILYHHCKKKRQTIALYKYLLWIAIEIVVMSVAFALLEILGFADSRPFTELLKISFGNTALILLLPYGTLWLYYSWKDKDKRLKAIQEYKDAGRMSASISEAAMERINFYDSKGELKFSVKACDLIYIKGADNYVTIHYADGVDHVGTSMIRSTFKSIEPMLKSYGIVRCHRSYMVNSSHIKLFEKTKDGFIVRMDTSTPLNLPVSKNYVQDVYELFGSI